MNKIRKSGRLLRHQSSYHLYLPLSILALFLLPFLSSCGYAGYGNTSSTSSNAPALMLNHPYQVKGVIMKVTSIDIPVDKARVPVLGINAGTAARIICSIENTTGSTVQVDPALIGGGIEAVAMTNGVVSHGSPPSEVWTDTLQPHQQAMFEYYFGVADPATADQNSQQVFNLSVTSPDTGFADYHPLFAMPQRQPDQGQADSTNHQILQPGQVYQDQGISMTVDQVESQKTLDVPDEYKNDMHVEDATRFIHIVGDFQNTTGEDTQVWPWLGSAKLSERETGEVTWPLMVNGTITYSNSKIDLYSFLTVHAYQTVHWDIYFEVDATFLVTYKQLAFGFVPYQPGPNKIQPDAVVISLTPGL